MERVSFLPLAFARAIAGPLIAASFLLPVAAQAQAIVAVVNGAPISTMDVQNRSNLAKLSGHKGEQRAIVEELVEERLKMLEARRVGLAPSDAEVETAYGRIAQNMNLTLPDLTRALASRGVSADSLKSKLRADLGWNRFVREKFRATAAVRDEDVIAALGTAPKPTEEDIGKLANYKITSIIFVLPKGASEAATAQRRKEADALRARFKSCESGLEFAKSLRDVAIRPPIVRSSATMSPKVRDLLAKTPVGTLTPADVSDEGVEMFAVCDKKEEKGSMALQDQLREQLTTEGMEVQARKYLNDLRARAVIEYR